MYHTEKQCEDIDWIKLAKIKQHVCDEPSTSIGQKTVSCVAT